MFNGIWLQPGDSTLWNVPIDDPNLICEEIPEEVYFNETIEKTEAKIKKTKKPKLVKEESE